MVERKTWAWLAAGAVVVGAGAFAQSGVGDRGRGDARPMVQLPPAAVVPASSAASAPTALSPASLTTTVGGYTYDWTALQAAIDADAEVAR